MRLDINNKLTYNHFFVKVNIDLELLKTKIKIMKIKKLFLFTLIFLSSLQGNDTNHTKCKHDKPLLQKGIKVVALSFSVAHLEPVVNKIYPTLWQTLSPFFTGKDNSFTPQKLIQSVSSQSIKETFRQMKLDFWQNTYKTPQYIVLLLSCKILTNFGLGFIF